MSVQRPPWWPGGSSSNGDDETVTPPDLTAAQLYLGVAVMAMFLLSHVPQIAMLLRRRSHVGLSLMTPALLAVAASYGMFGYLANNLKYTQQFCADTTFDCIASLLPLLQMGAMLLCAEVQMGLHLWCFDFAWLEEHYFDVEANWRRARLLVAGVFMGQLVFATAFIALWFADDDTALGSFASVCAIVSALAFSVHTLPQLWASYQLRGNGSVSVSGTILLALTYAGLTVFTGLTYQWYVYVPFAISATVMLVLACLQLYFYCCSHKTAALLAGTDHDDEQDADEDDEAFSPKLGHHAIN